MVTPFVVDESAENNIEVIEKVLLRTLASANSSN
jgi:hypothetical protein